VNHYAINIITGYQDFCPMRVPATEITPIGLMAETPLLKVFAVSLRHLNNAKPTTCLSSRIGKNFTSQTF